MDKRIYFDGAMGSVLNRFSNQPSAYINMTNPKIVEDIHREYLKLGIGFITTNSFNIEKNENYSISELVKASIDIANNARSKTNAKLVFSIGPCKRYETYKDIILSCKDKEFDYYLVETMVSLKEVKVILDLIREYDDKPIILSFVVKDKLLLDQNKIEDIFKKLNLSQIEAIGINCTDSFEDIKYALDVYRKNSDLKFLIMPNSGNVIVKDDFNSYEFNEDLFKKLKNETFDYLGGCCGVDSKFLRSIIEIDKL